MTICEDCEEKEGAFTVEVDEDGNTIEDDDAPPGRMKKVCRDCRSRY